MSEFIVIEWKTASLDEARKVSRYLVSKKLVACAEITPWLESVYLWNGQLETSQESKVSLKSKKEHFEEIAKVIKENTSYQVPEILAYEISFGEKNTIEWLEETFRNIPSSAG